MKTIAVGSGNPVKIRAALNAFRQLFPEEEFQVYGEAVPSGVSDQPTTDEETLIGAQNRAEHILEKKPQAHFWVGIEGGVAWNATEEMEVFAWIQVISSSGARGKARTGTFFLPPAIAEMVKSGMELGDADDRFFSRQDSKRANGSVGLLTGNAVDRESYYQQAIILALIPIYNAQWYNP